MTKEERKEYAEKVVSKLIKDAKINMTLDEFVKAYSSNRGIENNVINVCRNIEKYQLTLEGNYKYLYKILDDELNFMQENPKYYSEAVKRATEKYKKENIKRVVVSLNRKTDNDILERLAKEDNVQGYIKELIRKDIEC